jgi:hypothetical protein
MTTPSIPRAAHGESLTTTAAVLLALLVFWPLAPVAAGVSCGVLWRQHHYRWQTVAAIAGGLSVAAWALAVVALGDGWFAPLQWQLRQTLLAAQEWPVRTPGALMRGAGLGGVLGVFAGAAAVGVGEYRAGGAEWHHGEQRRRAVAQHHRRLKLNRLLSQGPPDDCPSPPLGVVTGGSLAGWTSDEWAVMPSEFRGLSAAFVGGSGSGKTKAAVRAVWARARCGSKIFFADCKGTDPHLAGEVVASVRLANPEASVAFWPAQPFDMWRGQPHEVASKLLAVIDTGESAYYASVTETVVRLACSSPEGPVRSSTDFLSRLSVEYLAEVYKGTSHAAAVALLSEDMKAVAGIVLRYQGFFSALAGRFDGDWSFEDVDCAVLSAPSLAEAKDADAAMRLLLADFSHYCAARKPRIGEDALLLIDEFSAIDAAAPLVINLAERVRDVGGQVAVTAQSWHGLGRDDDERARLAGAMGAVFLQRTAYPDELVKLGGTIRATEHSWQLDTTGSAGMGNVKMGHRLAVDPDRVRQAEIGDCWIIRNGRWLSMRVVPVDVDEADVWSWAGAVVRSQSSYTRELELRGPLALEPPPPPALNAGGHGPDRPPLRVVFALSAAVKLGELQAAQQIAHVGQTLACDWDGHGELERQQALCRVGPRSRRRRRRPHRLHRVKGTLRGSALLHFLTRLRRPLTRLRSVRRRAARAR